MPYQTRRDRRAVTDVMRWEVWNRDNFTCQVCHSRMFLEIDHIIPVSKGGANIVSNLQTLCANCNGRKRDHSRALLPGESCSDPECGHVSNSRPRDVLDEVDEMLARNDPPFVVTGKELPLDL